VDFVRREWLGLEKSTAKFCGGASLMAFFPPRSARGLGSSAFFKYLFHAVIRGGAPQIGAAYFVENRAFLAKSAERRKRREDAAA
jgi:hypothetical protein